MKRRTHYILFIISLLVAAFSVILIFRINVNMDMSKYLPDDSQMTIGKDSLESEFGSISQLSGSSVHVMFDSPQPNEVQSFKTLFAGYPDVRGVTYRYSADSSAIVFDLDVPENVNQKALGGQIRSRFGGTCVVETNQDGATPPLSVMIISGVMIMLVLIVMAQSWFEPIVILITAGIAIVLNMGTNALLPSVSMTTNFIGPILQAVLSLDYCIVLLNRYRQEQKDKMDRETAVIAANNAVKRAMPSILSSAFTTVVGLLMLCFMRLKIGTDMGVVLAKGVAFSLICTFTVMPSLIMLFRRTINKTAKPAYIPPTDRFARFVARHKLPMATGAVALFVAAWFLAQKTNIFFSERAESKIEEVFPATNPFVVLYHTEDEESVFGLAESLMDEPGVQTIVSYPTLMKQRMTPAQMATHVRSLMTNFKDFMPEGVYVPAEAVEMMNTEIVQLVYYMRGKDSVQSTMTFPDLARFLHTHVAPNPMFSSFLDENMVSQIALLQSVLDVTPAEPEPEPKPVKKQPEPKPEPEDTVTIPRETIAPIEVDPSTIEINDRFEMPHVTVNKIAIVPFFEKLRAVKPSATTVEMHKLTDTFAIRLPHSINEMSVFMGSSKAETRMVYNYAPNGVRKMTPLQYVHLLSDDLFKRPGVGTLVSESNKKLLNQRAHLMDLANENASLTAEELLILIEAFGVKGMTTDELLNIANPPKPKEVKVALTPDEVNKEDIVSNLAQMQTSLFSTDTTRAAASMPAKEVKKPKRKYKTKEEKKAELFNELAFSGKAFEPDKMSEKMNKLMELSSVNMNPVTESQMSLLYDYYYSLQCEQCRSERMSLEQMLDYVCDTLLLYDQRLPEMIPEAILQQVIGMRSQMQDGLGKLRKDRFSLFVVISDLPAESPETYAFVDTLFAKAKEHIPSEHYLIGRSVMYHEMKNGFGNETRKVSLFTILAIFLIVAITFRSLIVPTILVIAVMTAVYVNVVVAGLVTGQMLYLAYLIVQAILMGAAIDYGILFANYYRESRKTMVQVDAVCAAYRGSIRTILTSGLIMVIGPGAMALFVDDLMIRSIVGSLAVGAFMAVVLTLTVVPAVLVALDKWVVYGKKNRFAGKVNAPAECKKK